MAGRPKSPLQRTENKRPRHKDRTAAINTLIPAQPGSKLSFDEILDQLWKLALKAEKSGSYMASIRATELIGKHMGMFIERSVSLGVTTDLRAVSEAQLDQVITEAKRQNLLPAGDVIDMEVLNSTGQEMLEIQQVEAVENSDCKNYVSINKST